VSSDVEATVIAGLSFGALHAISGPLSGQTFPLKMDGFYIGRDRTLSQVVIEHPSVSKRHVWVGVREGVVTAIDQSSTNGTYLNALGTRIGETRLAPGDVLILSDDVARFVYRG
jgi:pSer/pThr/pTyr-binding forkhead associated (FHA) protein